MNGLYAIFSSVTKYIFILIVYVFIYAIIKMIFLDIRKIDRAKKVSSVPKGVSYLELVTNSSKLYFDVKNVYPLKQESIVIGRSPSCDICIDDLYMSSKHAQLWNEDNEWYLADLNSTNGTFVNGEKLGEDSVALDNGDRIRIGQIEFTAVIV